MADQLTAADARKYGKAKVNLFTNWGGMAHGIVREVYVLPTGVEIDLETTSNGLARYRLDQFVSINLAL